MPPGERTPTVGSMQRVMTIIALTIAIGGGGALSGSSASAAGRDDRKYPPARLWYRIALSFHGDSVRPHVAPFPAPPALPSIPSVDGDGVQGWVLRSRNAVLLRLRCADLSDPDDVRIFTLERRVRGRRRPVGGCPRRDGPFEATISFAAQLAGRLVDWRTTETRGEHYRGGGAIRCGGSEHRNELIAAQGLQGLISTPSSVVRGFGLVVSADEPTGTFSFVSDWDACARVDTGVEVVPPATNTGVLGFPESSLRGDEYIRKVTHPAGPWIQAGRLINFAFPPGRFGSPWGVARQVSQALIPGPPYSPPFSPGVWHADRKAYTYSFQFEACPRRGRNVRSC